MLIGTYNCLSLVSPALISDISLNIRHLDLLGLTGAQMRADRERGHETIATDHHEVINFGYRITKHSNRSAGLAVLAGPRFRKYNIKQVLELPRELAERAAAVRIKQHDVDADHSCLLTTETGDGGGPAAMEAGAQGVAYLDTGQCVRHRPVAFPVC